MGNLFTLLGKLTLWNVKEFAESSNDEEKSLEGDREIATSVTKANVVGSELTADPGYHAVLLDLDVPAYLVESSTPGHSHLYIDVAIEEVAYFRLLKALADAGVIEDGYLGASRARHSTFLRLPWVKREKSREQEQVELEAEQVAVADDSWLDFMSKDAHQSRVA